MLNINFLRPMTSLSLFSALFMLAACGAQSGVTNVNLANAGTNSSNSGGNTTTANSTNSNGTAATTVVSEAKEPEAYQATVSLHFEAIADSKNTALPDLIAKVARSGSDRLMEFTMPAGGRVIFLDKGGKNYLILPEKKQYAELNAESLGFEVRRLLLPEQIVQQAKSVPGMRRVGEEKYKGRDAIKYAYAATANTQTRAGQVDTNSFLLVDKVTGLPLRSETVSQSEAGANVQGFSGVKVITEIRDIQTEVPSDLFAVPTDLKKVEDEQIRAQVNLLFSSVTTVIGQLITQGQPVPSQQKSPAR